MVWNRSLLLALGLGVCSYNLSGCLDIPKWRDPVPTDDVDSGRLEDAKTLNDIVSVSNTSDVGRVADTENKDTGVISREDVAVHVDVRIDIGVQIEDAGASDIGQADTRIDMPPRVVYLCTPEGNPDICMADPDGRNKINLTNNLAKDWNGDTNFEAERDVPYGPLYYKVPISWSADGRFIAFVSKIGDISTLYTLNLETRELVEVLNGREGITDIHFSPIENKIAFPSSQGGRIIDLDSGELSLFSDLLITNPTWFPDGSGLVYASDFGFYRWGFVEGSVRLNVDYGRMNDVSSDGTKVLYAHKREINWDIYMINLGNNQRTRETDAVEFDFLPRWLSDNKFVFVSTRDGNYEIYSKNLRSGELRNLSNNPFKDTDPAVSPDGLWVVYSSDRMGTKDLYKVSVDGGLEERLTDDEGDEEAPSWSR